MKLFSKPYRLPDALGEGPAGKIAGKILAGQARLAAWLNRKTRHYSARHWLVLLILFGLLVGTTCMYLIITSINL